MSIGFFLLFLIKGKTCKKVQESGKQKRLLTPEPFEYVSKKLLSLYSHCLVYFKLLFMTPSASEAETAPAKMNIFILPLTICP